MHCLGGWPAECRKINNFESFDGEKISAVSSKEQTTRNQIMAIKTVQNVQMIFIDTPGIPKNSQIKILPEGLAESIWESCTKSDLIMFVVDLTRKSLGKEMDQLRRITVKYPKMPIFLVLNKVDKVSPENILHTKDTFFSTFPSQIKHTFATIGMKSSSLQPLLKCLLESGVSRDWEYPPVSEALLSKTERTVEIIRDKIFKRYNAEIPYSVRLSIESWNESEEEIAIICNATVPRLSHKVIMIGKNGECLQFVREKSIEELENIFKKKIRLLFMIKVKE